MSCTTWASVAQADNPFNYSGLTKTSTALPRLAVLVFVNPLYSAISKIYSDTRLTKTSTALPRLAVLVFVNPLYSAISKIYSDTRVI
ncbi:hypothetical protein [Neisseria meningitidis]|uniref:hypothetical protein n=1 Tax=Neisseria meningitidis TaxID=487 RepID=UPI0025777C90|nr:hypothetical protein [Neisseria meningitidis]